MIFPNLSPVYYADQDASLSQRKEEFCSESLMINQSRWSEANIDMGFYSSDQSVLTNYYGQFPANRHKQFTFNRIKRSVDMVGGYQRKNRKTTIVVPVENANAETADEFTKILLWNDSQEGILETISEAFLSAMITGMSMLHVWLDFRSDPLSGNIKVDHKPYNSFIIDPYFRKQDLSDCKGIVSCSHISRMQAMSMFPGREKEIAEMPRGDWQGGKFNAMPEASSYATKNLLTYDEFYYMDFRRAKMLIDKQTGEVLEWKSDDEEALRFYLQQFPQIDVSDQDIPTVSCDLFLQDKVMYHGPNPLGIDQFPFVPFFAYYHPEVSDFSWRIQGMVRGLRDAQYLYNRRRGIELQILESQMTSGIKYKENALVNPADAFLTGQGKGLALKSSAQMSDVEQIMPPQIPPSMIQLSELLAKEVQEISGVNEELLGSAVDDKVGILAMLRQGAGLTVLQRLFDNLDFSQKLLGKIRLNIIQNDFTPGKVANILQKDPSPQFYNKNFGRYDCVIEEGMYTGTQRQMQFAQMIQLREMGVPISDQDLIEAATIQNKKEIIENMQKSQQQQQQMQQAQAQAEMQQAQANIKLLEANAVAAEGLGRERISRIAENQEMAVERRAEAVKDQQAGFLDMVRALKEIESIDINHLQQLVSMMRMVQEKTAPIQQQRQSPLQDIRQGQVA